MIFLRLTDRGIGLLSTVILARLLVPDDFGLIAMAVSIIAALELFSSFSFDIALIQKQHAGRPHYDTVWTFNVLFSLATAIVLFAIAGLAANFYHEPRLEMVVYLLAVGSLLQGFENVGIVNFRKTLMFRKEFHFLLSKRIVAFAFTVPAAVILRNYWALLLGILASKLAGVFLSYMLHPYRPRLSLSAWRELFQFSGWLFLNNILLFIRFRASVFIIGKAVDPHAVGLYSIADEIANLPSTELIAPINRAVFPGYAKMASDLDALRQSFLNVLSAVALFSLPAGIGVAATAELLVDIILGDKWQGVVPLIRILALYGVIVTMQTGTGYVYLAIGKPRLSTILAGAYVCVFIPLLISLTRSNGVQGAAWASLYASVILLPIALIIISRVLSIRPTEYLAVLWRPLAATGFMYFAVRSVMEQPAWIAGLSGKIVHLLLAVLVGVVSYAVLLLALWYLAARPRGVEHTLMERLVPIARSFFAAR